MTTYSVEETLEAGRVFAEKLPTNAAVFLYGEPGAGKTHFVKGMAVGLGITAPVTSPTFALVNDYGGLLHFDLYRIHTDDDLYAIGFYDYIGQGVLAIEWAQNVPELAQEFDARYDVRITAINENEREICVNAHTRS
ncbi:MAG: tRNA (adenosine(37)-N6)-threonylcarbamoyltransferase complex ATPase subunit type 1 TsaE [Oscillospiraceae bacterium]|nr:tRNA (adenosine(37)-N6)-threonylcarbamoyltransferase complex ATPase subunit type 1 TsaE [Oscillospiraceae bacterium]